MGRQNNSKYLQIVENFINDAKSNPELLYSVTLTDRRVKETSINVSRLFRSLGVKNNVGRAIAVNLPEKLAEIVEMMRAEGLFPEGVEAKDINHINQMKLLLQRLEDGEEPIDKIQVYGNRIRLNKLVSDFPGYEFTTGMASPSIYRDAAKFYKYEFLPRIFELLQSAGIHNRDNYVPVSRRERRNLEKNKIDLMMETSRGLVVESVDDLEATCSEPFDVLYYLMALAARRQKVPSTVSNFYYAYDYLRHYLRGEGFSGNEGLFSLISKFTPLKFRAYLEDLIATGQLSPSYGSTILSAFHISLDRLVDLKGADSFGYIRANGFDTSGRTTDLYKPYPKKHREIISQVLTSEIDEIWDRLNRPYFKSDILDGETFLVDRGNQQIISSELCTEMNLRWYFDHELDSKRITFTDVRYLPRNSKEALFYEAVRRYRINEKNAYDSLEELYEAWGLPRNIYSEELFPFYCRLLQVTGMNPDSALNLEVDAYEEEHPATLKPCLRYWKARSDGAKEMHLDIFDAEITWLTKSQAVEVSDLTSKLIFLTRSLRTNFSEEDERTNLLFIAAGRPPRRNRELVTLEKNKDRAKEKLVENNVRSLVDFETGESIPITTSRFRSSLVSELVDSGVSVREIQLMLGHGSITTTLGYLDRMDFNSQAREKINEKLNQIYHSALIATDKDDIEPSNTRRGEVIYKTPLGGCANIFNPPDFIKNSNSYNGGACSNFNKCLSCPNVIITRSHLPDLFALLRDYKAAWGHGAIARTPHGEVVRENIEILESILGKDSEFDLKELAEAERLSLYIESTILIDGVGL